MTVPPASVSSSLSASSLLSPGINGSVLAQSGCHDRGHWQKSQKVHFGCSDLEHRIPILCFHRAAELSLGCRDLTWTCVSPLLSSPSLVVSAFLSPSAPWSDQMTGCLSFPYWMICGPDSLGSVIKCQRDIKKKKKQTNTIAGCKKT